MRWDKTVRVYIEPDQPARSQASRLRFLGLLNDVLEPVGATMVHAHSGSAMNHDGPSLTFEGVPVEPDGLVFRKVHHAPFWQIDRRPEPFQCEVASENFDPEAVERTHAEIFFHYWRDRIFGDAPCRTSHDGFVLVTLTGDLLRSAPGQDCAPMEMLHRCLRHEPDRPVVVSLDPLHRYSEEDFDQLKALDLETERLSVRIGETKGLLRSCDYVVTQSGTIALDAAIFAKPSILFADSDAHHISLRAKDAPQDAFDNVSLTRPDFAGYVTWFLDGHAINVLADDAQTRIAARLRGFGWPV